MPDTNTGSTIILSKKEDNGVISSIHMTLFKDDAVKNNTITGARYSTITENVTDNISASVSVTPIVTYDAENAFAFDIQANEQISFNFIRKNPAGSYHKMINGTPAVTPLPDDSSDDDRLWSNRRWVNELVKLVNRWQAESDGCILTYEPIDPALQHGFSVNVFLRNVTHTMSINSNEIVKGSIDAQVGSMTGDAIRASDSGTSLEGYNDKINFEDMSVCMTSSDGLSTYTLYRKGILINGEKHDLNCVSSYTLKGGPEQPFEYLVMEISKKRLSVVAPNLLNDIIAGRNRVTLNAMGKGTFIVTKCSTSSTTYKIIAYSTCEIYRSTSINQTVFKFGGETLTTPFNIIYTILTTQREVGMGSNITPVYFTADTIKYAFFASNNVWGHTRDECSFSNNSSSWYIISVCALKLNCKVWFSDGYAYLIDPTITQPMLAYPEQYGITTNIAHYNSHISKIYLNESEPYPLSATDTERKFSKSVCDTISLGDEGAETICNFIKVQFDSEKDGRNSAALKKGNYMRGLTATCLIRPAGSNRYVVDTSSNQKIAQSQAKYGIKQIVYKIPEIGNVDADDIAIKVAESYCDGEQSVGFKLKEMHIERNQQGAVTTKYWQKYFPSFTQVDSIIDYSNDLVLSNRSNYLINGERPAMPNKLCLSTFEHNFPEGTTKYWFGIMKPTDITQNTSEISNAIYNQ